MGIRLGDVRELAQPARGDRVVARGAEQLDPGFLGVGMEAEDEGVGRNVLGEGLFKDGG
jgi:hypothetical protein